jgi:hypothetical protein
MRSKSSVRHGKELFGVEGKEDIMDHSMEHFNHHHASLAGKSHWEHLFCMHDGCCSGIVSTLQLLKGIV